MGKYILKFALFISFILLPITGNVYADAPEFDKNFTSQLSDVVIQPSDMGVSEDQTIKDNMLQLFYPSGISGGNKIYDVIKGLTLGFMIIFILYSGAELLFDKDPKKLTKCLWSIVYTLLGGIFIYGANRIFGSVLNFNGDSFDGGGTGIEGLSDALTNTLFFKILAAIKAFAFFLAIVMIVVTGIRVVAAGEGDKGKKLIKGVINVVFALLVIKGIDVVYYIAADATNFVEKATELILSLAKVFGYVYGVIIIIMVFIAGYFYLTDGGGGDGFKKASNILVNILLSGLVLFAFLLILYQLFSEFSTGGDAVEEAETVAFNLVQYRI